MISAASAQIEAIGGDNMKITIIKNGKPEVVPDYAKVQGILLGTIAAFVIFITIIGPECVFVLIFSSEPENTYLCLFFRTEIMDLTLSKRSRGLRTVVINGVQLKTKRKLRTSSQKIPTKNNEISPSIPISTLLLNRMMYDKVCWVQSYSHVQRIYIDTSGSRILFLRKSAFCVKMNEGTAFAVEDPARVH
jgi:hypothetical protein